MSNVAIRCEGLSKQYRIGSSQERYKALRDVITDAAAAPFRRLSRAVRNGSGNSKSNQDQLKAAQSAIDNSYIWALDDVSFEIETGEVVGIIGRNGAGKSTLLKILSRITKPTRGRARVHGRVGSLLEVGTGFHPELTGRENIYLNGAILGMRKSEIARKFDEIVAFSEVEKFIDTPVKRYSSGMYMRLAFGVAAHMETEVLLVDEVLAIGDAQFQKKCFARMSEIGRHGRTILFVSHNMSAVRTICEHALVIDSGKVVAQGEVNHTIDHYLAQFSSQSWIEGVETPTFSLHSVEVTSERGPVIKTFDPVQIRVEITPKTEIADPGLFVSVLTMDSRRIASLDLKDFMNLDPLRAQQKYELGFRIESLPLLPGNYQLEIHLQNSRDLIELVPQTYRFEVAETQVYGGRQLGSWFGNVGLKAQALVPHQVAEEQLTR
ncbi:MAG TPA: ABC transporter ATP-binding protein [Pyrinomonadaceae bacterium]|jgi:lipopolysaccharide transport system ATP-binding protein|nr:ABC transporter ATP-binding protein [Pyrinomonadaceae bacterium]